MFFCCCCCCCEKWKPQNHLNIYKTEKITAYQSFFSPAFISVNVFVAREKNVYFSLSLSFMLCCFFRPFWLFYWKCIQNNAKIPRTQKKEPSFERKLMQMLNAFACRFACFIRCTQITVIIRWYPVLWCRTVFLLHRRIQSDWINSIDSTWKTVSTVVARHSVHIQAQMKFNANANSTFITLFVYAAGENKVACDA